MPDTEIAELLAGPHKVQLATQVGDGTIHLVTMFDTSVGGRVTFWTYARSQKAVNLRKDPRVTCLIETGGSDDQLRGVQLVGSVEVVEDYDRVLALGRSIYRRYFADPVAGVPAREDMARKRVAFGVDPERVVTWDHRRVAG